MERYQYQTIDDMYAAIGYGGISVNKIIARLLEEYKKEHEDEILEEKIEQLSNDKPSKSRPSKTGVVVKGIDNCLVKLSKCCNPLPGDEIVGYITKGRGVSVHRSDCDNVKELFENEKERMIDVYWFDDLNGAYKVEIEILATDRTGLLRDIIKQVENYDIKLLGVNTKTTKEQIAIMDLSLEIENKDKLNKVIAAFRKVENVYEVERKRS
jgi:GTP pyrophosphokinase